MATPAPTFRRPLKKSDLAGFLKPLKPTLYSDALGPPRLSAPPPNIRSLSWSATGTLLATCNTANIRIWNADRPDVKKSTEVRSAHPKGGADWTGGGVMGDQVEKVAFCPALDAVLASCGGDGVVRLWDVRVPGAVAGVSGKGTPLGSSKVGGDAAFLTWHPNGREMLVGRKDDVVHSIDVRLLSSTDNHTPQYQLDATQTLPRGKDILYSMAFSNSGREVFATTAEGCVRILDYPTMAHLHTLSGHPAPCYSVQHSPSGTTLVVGSGDSTISVWDTSLWLTTHTLTAPSQTTSIRNLSFSFDGAYLVAGAGTGTSDYKEGGAGLNVYHVDTGEVVHTVETTHCPAQVAWHPGRYWIAYAGDGGGVKVVGGGATVL
ncbi:hypothetical protein LTR53_005437 [Teratosphaeriaceae sp. CCFEE 6253]|nr:hypothetical protein LTR53_005437 [Teratosphaeriaceae sp. CCFEE 6253]